MMCTTTNPAVAVYLQIANADDRAFGELILKFRLYYI